MKKVTSNSKFCFLLAIVSLMSACAQPPPQLKGTDLSLAPAPDFRLTDQNGNSVSLHDLRGKVVALTFLYTHCPDVCPLIAERMGAASQQLGDQMKQTAFVAISVDPENDTPAAIQTFVQEHHLAGQLIYLNGTLEQLQPIWKIYYVYAQPGAPNPEFVSHSTRVILIDKAGKQRVNLDSDFPVSDLVDDVRILLNE